MTEKDHLYTVHSTYTGTGCAICGRDIEGHYRPLVKLIEGVKVGAVCKWCGSKIPTDDGNYLIAPCTENPGSKYGQHEYEFPEKEGGNV